MQHFITLKRILFNYSIEYPIMQRLKPYISIKPARAGDRCVLGAVVVVPRSLGSVSLLREYRAGCIPYLSFPNPLDSLLLQIVVCRSVENGAPYHTFPRGEGAPEGGGRGTATGWIRNADSKDGVSY
ncbi:MAG: hypothetical protein J6J18_11980, partial [Oscillospiraceae bacterium]|nr:hypothetical protein [Oscillospiraceae bacterium]